MRPYKGRIGFSTLIFNVTDTIYISDRIYLGSYTGVGHTGHGTVWPHSGLDISQWTSTEWQLEVHSEVPWGPCGVGHSRLPGRPPAHPHNHTQRHSYCWEYLSRWETGFNV